MKTRKFLNQVNVTISRGVAAFILTNHEEFVKRPQMIERDLELKIKEISTRKLTTNRFMAVKEVRINSKF